MFCRHRIILSVDGCGFKGIIPLKILTHLHELIVNENADVDVTSWVDLFTSTSASSIFTGALMLKDQEGRTKYQPKDLLNFYLNKGEKMFSKNIGLDAENSAYPLSFVLEHFFGKVQLKELKNHFLFYSYNESAENIVTFSKTNDRFYNLPLSKVMSACSVDGEHFPAEKIGNQLLMDGSFLIKNPAELSYNYMKMLYPSENIVLISLGFKNQSGICNVSKSTLPQEDVHQKLLQIAKKDNLLHYFRYQPELSDLQFEDDANVNNKILLDLTENYIHENRANFEKLLELMMIRTA